MAAQHEPTPREQLEAVGRRAAPDQHQLLASGCVEEQLDRTFRLPGLEEASGEPDCCLGRVEAAVGDPAEVDALLSGGARELDVSELQRCGGATRTGSGFNATVGFVALLTTIPGAVVGGSLLLLALDIACDWRARDRLVESGAAEPLEARPSMG